MPYSIRTKDDITINNIPDDIAPDDDILKQRVVDIRAERDGEKLPSDAQPEQTAQPEQPIIDGVSLEDALSEGGIVESVVEPITTIATGTLATAAGGLLGGAAIPLAGLRSGVNVMQDIQEAGTFQPRTKAGQRGLQTFGDLMEAGIDLANIPLSGFAGLLELATGQGVDQAVETIENVQEEGVSKTLGDRVFEETGDSFAAGLAESTPEATLLALGIRKTPQGVPKISAKRAQEIDSILAESKRTGIDVLTTDIFNPKSIFSRLSHQFAERIPFVGTGGKRAAQQEQRIKALQDLDAAVPQEPSQAIFDSLRASRDKVKNAAGERLDRVAEIMDPLGRVPVEQTVASIDRAIASLTKPGKLPDPAALKDLENLKQTAINAGDNFSLLREFRTDARSMAEKVDVTGRTQLRTAEKASFDNIVISLTKDLNNFVLNNSTPRDLNRYKQADKVYRREAINLTKSRLKTALDKGDVTPEVVNNLLFSSKPSEVKLLFNNLGSTGRANARFALYRKALDDSVVAGEINPAKLITQLNKYEKNFNVFFRGDAKAEFNGFKRLFESTQRAQTAGVITPTGQSLLLPGGFALGTLVDTMTAIYASVTVGLGARAWESAGVRNLLIRLGKSTPRGTLELDLLKILPAVLTSANKNLQDEQERARQGDVVEEN